MVSLHFGILLVVFVHWHSILSQSEPDCENCGCCVDRMCGTHTAAGNYCTNGCIDGYGGYRCYNKCPIDCVTCQQNPWQDCKTCADKQYLNTTNRCVDCPDRCKNCTSKTECQECKFPYYNDDTITDCALSCPRNCFCEILGVCSSCTEGFYNPSNECLDSCPNTCTTCTDKTHCQSCQPTYSGDMCCIQDGHCLRCLSSTACGICTDGYYGEKCNLTCPITCQTVNQESSCEDGSYGDNCTMNCNGNCLHNRCNKDDGHCTEGCAGSYEGPKCMMASTSEPGINGAAVAGGLASVVIIIVIVIVVIVVIRKRQLADNHRKDLNQDKEQNFLQSPGPSCSKDKKTKNTNIKIYTIELEEDLEEIEEDEPLHNVAVRHEAVYENVTRVAVSGLEAYVRRKTKLNYEQEFAQLPKGLTQSYNDSMKPENVVKNRFKGLYPYDHSRVKIKADHTFFINACFIDGHQKINGYIASLGPTKKATNKFHTFWTMVWHMKSDVIVMLTNLHEPSGNKCEQYWPDMDGTNTHQDIAVSCQSVEVFAEYTVRTFTIEKKNKKRTIYQLHYTAWPDKTIPDEITSLVEFRQKVRSTPRLLQGPIIIHCSAGIGRTGTYIALDRLTEDGEAGERINVYECVQQMRQQRVGMVQTLEQYEFLHKALVHTLTFKCESIRAEEIGAYIRDTTDAEFKTNFKLLKTIIDEESSEELTARSTNARHNNKNRKNSDIPGDRYRPKLYICRSFDSSNYINAVFVNGFKKKYQYIIAQSPLQETVEDFLCLIFQENCCCVVSMEDAELIGTEIGVYIGADNQELKRGSFTVTASRCESKPHYILRKLTISNSDKHSSGTKIVYHYQMTDWTDDEKVPADVQVFTQSVKDVSNKADAMKNTKAPILVHCLNGAKRSGLFCAVSILLEKVAAEGQVSVPNTLRQLRARRKKAIPNKEQFKFCFRSIESHLESSNTYANFAP